MLSLLATAVFGLVVGVLAKVLMPGKDPGGLIITILLGIAGAFVGRWIGQALGLYAPGEPAGFIMATLGAILLLFVYRQVRARG